MHKKALFVALIWIALVVVVFVLYLLREVSPVKEFVVWALNIWPILAALGGIVIFISGWIIKHDFANPITPPTQDKPLEFMIKVETLSIRQSNYHLDEREHKGPQCLVMNISFKTNRVIQIASMHLEMNSVDPRDIYEPSPHLAQGFQLPHSLNQSETHEFQFEVLPAKKRGDYEMILRVLAGGNWYSDGPYSISL